MSSVSPINLNTYWRLCSKASLETLRRNPLTQSYIPLFGSLAKDRGIAHARAWLLGRLLFDLHPNPEPAPLDPSTHLAPPDVQTPHSHALPSQQDIKTA